MAETRDIFDRSEALEFLNGRGTKVAIQVGYEGDYIYAEKGDFIRGVLRGATAKRHPTFVNYDGDPDPAFVTGSVLHIPCGVR